MFLDAFDRLFDRGTKAYTNTLRRIVSRRIVTFGLLFLFGFGILRINEVLPSGFVPNEDQGMIYAIVQTPPGTTLERTNDVSRQLQGIAKSVDGVASVSSLAGYEILTEGRGSNAGTCLINLKGWSERKQSVAQIIDELEEKSKDIGAIAYGVAGGLTAPLLNRRAIAAQYRSANAKQRQAVFNDEQTLLQAFTDVANQLARIDNLQKSYELQSRQVDTLARSVDVSNVLFQSARADYMEVLLTRRESLEGQLALLETKKRQFQARVNLYQALGGGWRSSS